MRLTPLDIRKQEFKKSMRGLDPEEVYAFLNTVGDEYEAALNDNKALRDRVVELDDKVQEYRNMEKTLRDTLLTAERVTEEAKDNARREAELIIKQAELDADRGARDIKENAMRLRQEIQLLKRQRDSYLARMKMLVESHLKFIESAEADFDHEEKLTAEDRSDSPRAWRKDDPLKGSTGRSTKGKTASAGPFASPRSETPVAEPPSVGAKPDKEPRPEPKPWNPTSESRGRPEAGQHPAEAARLNELLERVMSPLTGAQDDETSPNSYESPATSTTTIDAEPEPPQRIPETTGPVDPKRAPEAWRPEGAEAPSHALDEESANDLPVDDAGVDPSPEDGNDEKEKPGPQWSLERLKRDILSRSRRDEDD